MSYQPMIETVMDNDMHYLLVAKPRETNLTTNKKAPMVVMIHVGPHGARDYWSFDSEIQLFASRGYAVL
ncbi:MAG: dipeptidyl aminopeptidase/acylaminoacyl peptidase [Paraglaciecola sp.]|jgi:dipeptidyl aminopeptidase/acylaminoacyl peptidase